MQFINHPFTIMKTFLTAAAASLAMIGASFAGGIEGRVVDDQGKPRVGVTISVKGHRQTTKTDSLGYYTLLLPPTADNTRVNVHVNGIFAVNCLVPEGNANSTVNVTLVRR